MMESNLKKVGVIGGLSHESSDSYSAGIHGLVNQTLGGQNNAELVQYDVNFQEIRAAMLKDDWQYIADYLSNVAESLMSIGAEYIAVASNTIHRIAPQIEERIGADHFIHIGNCIGRDIRCHYPEPIYRGEKRHALLLGTLETMNGDFLKSRLESYGLEIVTPGELEKNVLNDRIFSELCHGEVSEDLQKWYLHTIKDVLTLQPVDVIILGCTELSMIYNEAELLRRVGILGANGNHPFIVVDSKQAHIQGIAKASLGQW